MPGQETVERSIYLTTATQKEIVKTVLYFEVFSYPLTRNELFENSPVNDSRENFHHSLDLLISNGMLSEQQGYILTPWSEPSSIMRREVGNTGANKMMPVAYRYSRKISGYPFVEGVFLSGGLSKNYFGEGSDIDFFIVTRPGRLWIARTLLILKYKTLSSQKKKFWCVNYFVSSSNLQIPDVNRFTATELAFLIPAVNYPLYKQLLDNNRWHKGTFPNKAYYDAASCQQNRSGFIKRTIESMLGGPFGDWLDARIMNVTRQRWKRKYPEMNEADFELQFRSQRDVCKRHTTGFQNVVLKNWQLKQRDFENRFGVKL
jgi:hypothetical protein